MISIIVPVYNVMDYLPQCVESLLANDTADTEIILVDDGSKDDSGKLCDRFAEQHPDQFRVIHQENGGLGAARNTGMRAAKGTWFLFVDSDDRLAPNTLSVLKKAVAQGGAQMIGFQYCSDDGTNPPVPQSSGFDARPEPFMLQEHPDYLLSLPSAWMRLYHRSLFQDHEITYPSRVWYEDIRTTAKLLPLANGIRVLPDHLYYYLQRPGSIMNNKNVARNREILEALDDVLNWYRANGLFDRYRNELRALTVQHVLLAGSVRVARIDPKSELLNEFYAYTEKAFPDWKQDPYRKQLPRLKRLALFLVEHRRYRLIRRLFALKG